MSSIVQNNILNDLSQKGWAYAQPDYFMDSSAEADLDHLQEIQSSFGRLSKDPSPGNRYRAHVKLNWCPATSFYEKNTSNEYFQSKEYNYADGGRIRKFEPIEDAFLDSALIQSIIAKDIDIAKKSNMFVFDAQLEIGLHQIRYQPTPVDTAFSSPKCLHKDDEPLVFLHLLNISSNLLGGDNLFASNRKTILKTLRLTDALETLLFDQKIYHAVTPMSCSDENSAYRDILLVTFQRRRVDDVADSI